MISFPRFNIANRVTIGRFALTIVLFGIMHFLQTERLRAGSPGAMAALALFIVIAATDWLDGHLARSRNMVTPFGRIADPFVDKVVVCGSFIFLASVPALKPYLSPWIVVVVILREFLVNGIRSYLESRGIDFSAAASGKLKMVIQCISIGCLLGLLALDHPRWVAVLSRVSVALAVIVTVLSGVSYTVRATRLLRGTEI